MTLLQCEPSFKEAALQYALNGLRVLPLYGIGPDVICDCGKADCKSPGKHPLVPGGAKAATCDLAQVTAWWDLWPEANIGIATGAGSGIFVVDVDAKNGGIESLAALEAENGPLPRTVEVLTGSGGGSKHLYFKLPDSLIIRNSASKIAPGIDVRGEGGYVVAPPSRHVSGRCYRFSV
jgi:hypothetical protein